MLESGSAQKLFWKIYKEFSEFFMDGDVDFNKGLSGRRGWIIFKIFLLDKSGND